METPIQAATAPGATEAVPAGAPAAIPTAGLISAMVRSAKHVSDLIFSPGRPPQMEVDGQLVGVKIQGLAVLLPEHTATIAGDLMGSNLQASKKLRDEGSADLSYSLPKVARFRVNVFTQRGSCAIVMRVIPDVIPDFASLRLPEQLAEAAGLKNGIVLVTGPTGSGKSSTLAAILDRINAERACHIITIEDPIEFLHRHKKATIHQRELHSDTPSFALALRAALRQAPKVILVGEMRDRETMEIALEAAETGHLVLSTLHTIDASKTVERIIGAFALGDQHAVRNRLAKSFRVFVAQRLVPRKDGQGRVAAFEIMKTSMRTREYIEKGEGEGKSLVDAMRDGSADGMQCFDGELERMAREGIIDVETALAYATNAGNLRLVISDLMEEPKPAGPAAPEAGEKKPGAEAEIVRF
ncbi:MAG TPA: PilT/PilU family type 4a pilus ATPase [Candidatus Acidoferrales bacterium]|nr:PilT/PilU family type 4a pilus ATPase [Candidatus Acidoferrales bacterium]